MNDTRILSYAGSEFLAVLRHVDAVQFLEESGHALPAVPPGYNTISIYFTTPDRLQALALNQTGFARTLSDNEGEINGCSVFVCLDTRWDKQRTRYLLKELKKYLLN